MSYKDKNQSRANTASTTTSAKSATSGDEQNTAAASLTVGKLSVVGTPLGNLGDFSSRAQITLAHCTVIYCEDTRVTQRLLSAFKLHIPLERADEHTLSHKLNTICERIAAGEHVGYVSDAGMPAISDPGQLLVDKVLSAGLPVEVIPGPSAISAAVCRSGFLATHLFFEGFLPRKTMQRQKRLLLLSVIPATLVLYESPHRVLGTLEALAEISAYATRRIALCRELTKLHDEVLRGSAGELIEILRARPSLKGECVLVIEEDTKLTEGLEADRLAQTVQVMEPMQVMETENPLEGAQSSQLTSAAQGELLSEEEQFEEALRQARAAAAEGAARMSQLAKLLAKRFHTDRKAIYALLVKDKHVSSSLRFPDIP